MNDRVQSALLALEASVSQTLSWLAARKHDPVDEQAVVLAVNALTAPMFEAFSELPELAPVRECVLAECILACAEVPDGSRRNDNLLSWRYQRESFEQNVAELESWTRWATKALRSA